MSNCIFCRIASGEISSQRVYEDSDIFAFRDLNPQAPDHILIVPKKHLAKLADIGQEDQLLMGKLVVVATEIARQLGLDSGGYRIVVNNGESAGQSVWHLHLHLLSGRTFQWPPG